MERLVKIWDRTARELEVATWKLFFVVAINILLSLVVGKIGLPFLVLAVAAFIYGMWPVVRISSFVYPVAWPAILKVDVEDFVSRIQDIDVFESTKLPTFMLEIGRQVKLLSSIIERRYRAFFIELMLLAAITVIIVLESLF